VSEKIRHCRGLNWRSKESVEVFLQKLGKDFVLAVRTERDQVFVVKGDILSVQFGGGPLVDEFGKSISCSRSGALKRVKPGLRLQRLVLPNTRERSQRGQLTTLRREPTVCLKEFPHFHRRHPHLPILITHSTPTSRQRPLMDSLCHIIGSVI
jgi:hypothetical protein